LSGPSVIRSAWGTIRPTKPIGPTKATGRGREQGRAREDPALHPLRVDTELERALLAERE
jgi:hypothetical protein